MILKELPENVDALLGEPRVLSALDGISKRHETVIDIREPKAFFTCEDCLVELK
jgi:protease-4